MKIFTSEVITLIIVSAFIGALIKKVIDWLLLKFSSKWRERQQRKEEKYLAKATEMFHSPWKAEFEKWKIVRISQDISIFLGALIMLSIFIIDGLEDELFNYLVKTLFLLLFVLSLFLYRCNDDRSKIVKIYYLLKINDEEKQKKAKKT